ncbi:hypothetical protein FQA39_LY10111 [Lamprigera yunnana]|nr:hypothetical protein FQA39_LY10111 [Lamprigera yunnana]
MLVSQKRSVDIDLFEELSKKIPGCCVPECRNRSEGGYRLFSVPTVKNDDLRRKVWLDYINRRELRTRASICELDNIVLLLKILHFNDGQFEINRKENRKLLKNGGVPTRSLKRKHINEPSNLEGETSPSAEVISSKQGNMSVQIDCSEEVAEIDEPYVTNEQFQRLQNKLKVVEVNSFDAYEKHGSLLLDEVAIKLGLQYDNFTKTVIGRPTMMSESKDPANNLAMHALVLKLAGLSTRWKQTIGYEFTASS